MFDNKIYGQLSNKVSSEKNIKKFPRFKSYRKDLIINDILSDVDYRGGYTLQGSEFISDGSKNGLAQIIFKKEGKDIFIANSSRFSIKDNSIYSKSASINIYFDNDSIYHPSLQFNYDDSKRNVTLYRDRKGISGSPIYSSYHQLTMDAELLEWQIDEDQIYLGSLPTTSESNVYFSSTASYSDNIFQSLRGIDQENPLMAIMRFIEVYEKSQFKSAEFASFIGYAAVQVEHYLINLANKGFLFYDINKNEVTVQQKLYNYVNAKLQRNDYDVIDFKSKVKKSIDNNMVINSSLDLSTKDLNILGVDNISISDSQLVYIRPNEGKLSVKKNRDFNFSGRISVGRDRFVIYGTDFLFKYDDFKIELENIDSLQLSAPILPLEKDEYGNDKLVRIRTVIQAASGDLRIDDPNNKSGIRKSQFSEYPIFRSFDDSYVYYDKPSIFGGIYNRDNFFFHLDTFQIDSLENFNGMGLQFPGTFYSAGIFPVFEDTLTMMRDYSLGFKKTTPSEGLEIYSGKAIYNNNIYLSNQGLMGSGSLEYLNSFTKANEIYFFPDSTALFGQDFILNKIEQGIEFPDVTNTETFSLLQPYEDRYRIHKIPKGPKFNFYNKQAAFDGDIVLKPTGLIGSGTMILDKSRMISEYFTYNANWFDSDTADLVVYTEEGDVSFRSTNLKTHIDLLDRTGDFFSNGSGSYVVLPATQYISYIDKLHWEMDNEMLILGDNNQDSEGSMFVSTHPDQDSLSFIAKNSTYNLKNNVINLFGVDEILVADVTIYPSSKGFVIERDAKIPTITDVKIIADTMKQFHVFNNVNLDLDGRQSYTANGNYTYVDDFGVKQNIFFNEIYTNKEGFTEANANINESEPFNLGSQYKFKGTVNLIASNKNLNFDGYFKIKKFCNLINADWVRFTSEIDPQMVIFKLNNKLISDKDEKLATGVFMNLDSTHMYTSFLSEKERAIDVGIIKANSYLTYKDSNFIVMGDDSLSNIFSIDQNTCASSSEGIVDLNLDFGQLNIKSIGFVDRNERDNNTDLELFLLLDFMFSREALEIMANNIYEAYSSTEFNYDNRYKKNLARLVGSSELDELIIDLDALDEFSTLPDELNNALSFTYVNLVWSDKYRAYFSKGKIGLGNIYGKQLNSMMDGYIRLSKRNNQDVLNILLKTEFGDIYYFEYKGNTLFSYSTNDEFNNVLINTKAKKRRANEKNGKSPYRYVVCDEEKMEDFERQMRKK